MSTTKNVTALSRMAYRSSMNLCSDDYYGIRLLKVSASIVGYSLFYFVMLITIKIVDSIPTGKQFLHPTTNTNDAVFGATTILLTLLIPVAILLIEDARKSSLERQVILKSIARLQAMPIVLSLVCLFLFTPQGIFLFGAGVTLRLAYAAIVINCLMFVVWGFYRTYRWLGDSSTFSSGAKDIPSPDDPRPEAFSSYRFARIVKLLNSAKGHATWFAIWSQWFPDQYEFVLHQAFFKRELDAIRSGKAKRHAILSLELEAYVKYFGKRNTRSPSFYLEYLKPFFNLYALTIDRAEGERAIEIWNSERLLLAISQKLINNAFSREGVYSLFEAFDEYIQERDLLNIPDNGSTKEDELLNYFISKYFEGLFEDRSLSANTKTYIRQHTYWQATYENIFGTGFNISYQIVEQFKSWLFNKLGQGTGENGELFGIDAILLAVFASADPVTMAILYWFLYCSRNTSDAGTELESFYTKKRPFGLMGRIYTYAGRDDNSMQRYNQFQAQQQEAAIKLFAELYRGYLTQFYSLDELLSTGREKLENGTLSDDEKRRLQSLLDLLAKIKGLYDNSNNDSRL